MNEDILKGTWLEIKGRVKEELAKLADNDLGDDPDRYFDSRLSRRNTPLILQ